MQIRKGTIYWIENSSGHDTHPDHRWPGLVIQSDALNDSNLNTVNVLGITTILKFGELPGNVVLAEGEANMNEQCVVNVSRIRSVDKNSIKDEIGVLPKKRMNEIHDGLKLVMNIP